MLALDRDDILDRIAHHDAADLDFAGIMQRRIEFDRLPEYPESYVVSSQ